MNVIEKSEKLALLIQTSGANIVKIEELVSILSEITNSNVHFIGESNVNKIIISEDLDFPSDEQVNNTNNLHSVLELENGFALITPVWSNGKRLGVVVSVSKVNPTDANIAVALIISASIGKSITGEIFVREEENNRNIMAARNALKSLSFTEICAIQSIFDELDGTEGLLIASKIADRVGFTRSVIVNAVRKLEGACVVESRSLGMKGTHIKIINHHLLDELSTLNIK